MTFCLKVRGGNRTPRIPNQWLGIGETLDHAFRARQHGVRRPLGRRECAGSKYWEPIPSLPEELRLFSVHLILVSIAAIRQRQQKFGMPDDISWETLSYLGRAMNVYRSSHGEAGIHLTGWDWLRFAAWLYQVVRVLKKGHAESLEKSCISYTVGSPRETCWSGGTGRRTGLKIIRLNFSVVLSSLFSAR
jgi:hypothetical protein